MLTPCPDGLTQKQITNTTLSRRARQGLLLGMCALGKGWQASLLQ